MLIGSRRLLPALIAGLASIAILAGGHAAQGDTTRVSVDSSGTQGNANSVEPAIDGDGRYVVFESSATNLVPGDTNGFRDVFVHDRASGTTQRVSVDSSGAEGNGDSIDAAVTADGRYVVFESSATNLVAGDTNGTQDVFLHDRVTGVTERLSVSSGGAEGNERSGDPDPSDDGRYVVFESQADNLVAGDTNALYDIFVRDRAAGTTVRVSVHTSGTEADGDSFDATISADGRFVTFRSDAADLIDNDTNGFIDIFLHDRDADGDGTFDEPGGISTVRISLGPGGVEANGDSRDPEISSDGRYVVFESDASNLVAGDTNGVGDIFIYDRTTGALERVSVDSSGAEANGASSDGLPSADGRYVVFGSSATNLVSGDTNGVDDIFVRDRVAGTTARISVATGGTQGDGESEDPAISGDGRYIAFESIATNLVANDTNGAEDVFVHQFLPDPPTPTPTPSPTATPIPAGTATPTPGIRLPDTGNGPGDAGSPWTGAPAATLALALLGAAAALGARALRRTLR